ncbi:DNA repair-scaffolding protein-like [Glandiceps talaboti]
MDWFKRDEGFRVKSKRNSPSSKSNAAKKKRQSEGKSVEESWQRCTDGFDHEIIKEEKQKTPSKMKLKPGKAKSSEKKKITFTVVKSPVSKADNEIAMIDWNSSDSDSMEDIIAPSPPDTRQPLRSQSIMKLTANKKQQPITRQSIDAVISDYESPSEDEEVQRSAKPPQDGASQELSIPSISSGATTASLSSAGNVNTRECYDSGSSPKKGSDWLKSVQGQTPDKRTTAISTQAESTRKKKKFVRGGLAEQLHTILSREKSSMTFWSHQKANSKKSTSGSSLTVKVLSIDIQCNINITQCDVLSGTAMQDSTPTAITILFTASSSDQLMLNVGSVIKIYPPWQKLVIPHHKEAIILCTYFCQSVGGMSTEDSDFSSQITTSLQPSRDELQSSLSVFSPKKKLKPSQLFSNRRSPDTIETKIIVPVSKPKHVISESFLESIEEHGGHPAIGFCVQATVQRLYCKRFAGQSTSLPRLLGGRLQSPQRTSKPRYQWVFLLQDMHGAFCELQLPHSCTHEQTWSQCIRHGQGKVYVFSGLRVVQRTNRLRSPALFSLINSLCKPITSQTTCTRKDGQACSTSSVSQTTSKGGQACSTSSVSQTTSKDGQSYSTSSVSQTTTKDGQSYSTSSVSQTTTKDGQSYSTSLVSQTTTKDGHACSTSSVSQTTTKDGQSYSTSLVSQTTTKDGHACSTSSVSQTTTKDGQSYSTSLLVRLPAKMDNHILHHQLVRLPPKMDNHILHHQLVRLPPKMDNYILHHWLVRLPPKIDNHILHHCQTTSKDGQSYSTSSVSQTTTKDGQSYSTSLVSQTTTKDGQSYSTSSNQKHFESQAPSFCYVISTTGGHDKIQLSQQVSKVYRAPNSITLKEVLELDQQQCLNHRTSVHGRIIYARPEEQSDDTEHVTGYHVYISDISLQSTNKMTSSQSQHATTSYIYLHIRSSCYLLDEVRKFLTVGNNTLYFQDVCVEKPRDGAYHVYADSCSMVYRTEVESDGSSTTGVMVITQDMAKTVSCTSPAVLPRVDINSGLYSLVKVKGIVGGVDESTAFSWPACNICGNDRLQGGEDNITQLHCSKCNHTVSTPDIVMNLEVLIKYADSRMKDMTVKVQLLQKTIKVLLPVSEQPEDGYDIHCIMGKSVGPMSCFVAQISDKTIAMEEIDLEQ